MRAFLLHLLVILGVEFLILSFLIWYLFLKDDDRKTWRWGNEIYMP